MTVVYLHDSRSKVLHCVALLSCSINVSRSVLTVGSYHNLQEIVSPCLFPKQREEKIDGKHSIKDGKMECK
jgi:hypothetical protein